VRTLAVWATGWATLVRWGTRRARVIIGVVLATCATGRTTLVNWGATEKAEENLEEFGERGALKLDPLVRGEAATLGAGVAGSVVETGVVVVVG